MSDLVSWNERGDGFFPGHVGLEITGVEEGEIEARLAVRSHHLAPNGFLHAGSVITLADTCCGYGTFNDLPPDATGFTTIELKSSFVGTALAGDITCVARRVHRGRTTQVWDAEVASDESGKTIALFRCTQMVLYPLR
jgi:uncharacterized protein (TIGR00369 family)